MGPVILSTSKLDCNINPFWNIKPPGNDTGIYRENLINTMVATALPFSVAMFF